MMFGKSRNTVADQAVTAPPPPTLTKEQVADQLRQKRLELALQPQQTVFTDDHRLALSTLPDNRQLVALNGGSALPDLPLLPILEPISPEGYLRIWGGIIRDHQWKEGEFHNLAQDAWEALLASIEKGLEQQLKPQVQCLIRAITRDVLKGAGFDSQEVRFLNCVRGSDYHWSQHQKTRASLLENVELKDEYHHYYVRTNPNGNRQLLEMHNIHDTAIRISGQAFRALALLQRLPVGVVEDVWLAELLGEQADPLLIIQIGGYSYSLCGWEE